MNIEKYIGKRVLLKVKRGYSEEVKEYKVLEVSPSRNWVKLQCNYSGQKFWKHISDIGFVEALEELEPYSGN